ncbi:unnamed protein product [Moneuplotes crassus]|uniref:Uncharacterized protein n=1 Tax=Euplotes crassus TaxID=5936 RepID=A0AAD1Y985_EUPCR|nr:unnamed protein product [Moneuplotes crassus]
MRRKLSQKRHSLGNPMETIESMRTTLKKRSMKRIKGKIRKDLDKMCDLIILTQRQSAQQEFSSHPIIGMNDDGSMIELENPETERFNVFETLSTKSLGQNQPKKKRLHSRRSSDFKSNMNKLIKDPSLKQKSNNYILNIQRPATAIETAKEAQKVISPRFTKTDSKKPFLKESNFIGVDKTNEINIIPETPSQPLITIGELDQAKARPKTSRKKANGRQTSGPNLNTDLNEIQDFYFQESSQSKKSTKSAKRRKFKEKKEDIQKIFNKLASIARENLRQITQNDNPSSRELLTTFKGIEVLSGTKEVDGERIPDESIKMNKYYKVAPKIGDFENSLKRQPKIPLKSGSLSQRPPIIFTRGKIKKKNTQEVYINNWKINKSRAKNLKGANSKVVFTKHTMAIGDTQHLLRDCFEKRLKSAQTMRTPNRKRRQASAISASIGRLTQRPGSRIKGRILKEKYKRELVIEEEKRISEMQNTISKHNNSSSRIQTNAESHNKSPSVNTLQKSAIGSSQKEHIDSVQDLLATLKKFITGSKRETPDIAKKINQLSRLVSDKDLNLNRLLENADSEMLQIFCQRTAHLKLQPAEIYQKLKSYKEDRLVEFFQNLELLEQYINDEMKEENYLKMLKLERIINKYTSKFKMSKKQRKAYYP